MNGDNFEVGFGDEGYWNEDVAKAGEIGYMVDLVVELNLSLYRISKDHLL